MSPATMKQGRYTQLMGLRLMSGLEYAFTSEYRGHIAVKLRLPVDVGAGGNGRSRVLGCPDAGKGKCQC